MDGELDRRFAMAQASFFETAARCMRRPDRELAADVVGGHVAEWFGALLVSSADSKVERALEELTSFERTCGSEDPDQVRLRLEVEYNRLFVGPAALLAPPYESYYASKARTPEGGRLRTDEERAVVQAYKRQGFMVPAELAELPDHIAVELEYLFLLSDAEARAWSSGDVARAEHVQQAQSTFVQEHLGIWVGLLAGQVHEGARIPFYPAVLDLVTAFCTEP